MRMRFSVSALDRTTAVNDDAGRALVNGESTSWPYTRPGKGMDGGQDVTKGILGLSIIPILSRT
jgi:hypothetical protein